MLASIEQAHAALLEELPTTKETIRADIVKGTSCLV